MKKWRRCILGVLVIGAVVWAGGAWFFQHEPVARLPLADGTELRLEYVTYGTEHRVPGAGRFKAWLSRQAQRWPGLGIPVYEAEYRNTFEQPEVLLWFTRFNPRTGKYLPTSAWEVRATAEGPLSFQEADKIAPDEDHARPRWMTLPSFIFEDTDDRPPLPHQALVSAVFDRRKAELRLRFWDMSSMSFAEVTIPNPAAGTAFPTWQAEPLPQVRRVDELEVVLRAVKAQRVPETGAVEVVPQFELRHQGRGAGGIEWDEEEWGISDATGNMGRRLVPPPPLSEPVWKIRRPFTRTGDFPFAATAGRVLGPVRVPEAGKCEELPITEEERGKGLRLAVVVGPGYYKWESGELVVAQAPGNQTESGGMFGAGEKWGTIVAWSDTPTVLFVYEWSEDKDWWQFDQARVVRVRSGKGDFGLANPDFTKTGVDVPDFAVKGRPFALKRRDRPEQAEDGPAKPLPAGTEIWIQVVPVEKEEIEFLIVPPEVTGGRE